MMRKQTLKQKANRWWKELSVTEKYEVAEKHYPTIVYRLIAESELKIVKLYLKERKNS